MFTLYISIYSYKSHLGFINHINSVLCNQWKILSRLNLSSSYIVLLNLFSFQCTSGIIVLMF